MSRAILFKGAYATLDLFTEEIIKELMKRDWEVLEFDVNTYQQSLMRLAQFVQKPVELAMAYNNLGFNMELVPGQNIWDQLQIPFVNILVDHPFHYKNALDNAPENSIVLCIDRKHVDYIKRFWPGLKVYFMPHGSSYIDSGKPWKERNIEVLYAGGLSADLVEGLKPDRTRYDDFDADKLVEYAANQLVSNHRLTTEEVIEDFLIREKVSYDEARLSQIITDFRIVDSYAVSYFREKVIKTLVEHGIRVTVYGRGWDKRECVSDPNFVFGGYVRPDEILELMKDSKVVLNTMTWFKAGSHVRIFNGMMAGAVCITDFSEYVDEIITNGENGFIFELDDPDKLVSDIRTILDNEADSEQIALMGRNTAVKGHLFTNRVDYILELTGLN